MSQFIKDPDARVDYAIDWSDATSAGTAIADSQWSVAPVEPDGVTIEAHGFELVRATVTLSGGIAGHVYRIANRITLADGNIDERSLVIRVEQR